VRVQVYKYNNRSMEKVALTHIIRDRVRKPTSRYTNSKPQENKGNNNMRKDIEKWCEFHQIP
jgi:hypothetical protein